MLDTISKLFKIAGYPAKLAFDVIADVESIGQMVVIIVRRKLK